MTYVSIPPENSQSLDDAAPAHQGDDIALRQLPNATAIFDLLASLPADFTEEARDDTAPQDRSSI